MNSIERLKEIDNFFEKLSIEEFEQKLEAAGINEIKSSSSEGIELSLSLKHIIDKNKNLLYVSKRNKASGEETNYDSIPKDLLKAV